MISIIIPALNEEKHLAALLRSIKAQNLKDCEIIVADAGSKDKTKEIAEKYNCKVVPGGLPAKGRNEGAKIAKGDLLLFLDADVVLPSGFLKGAIKEFNAKKIEIATFPILFTGSKIDRFISDFYNSWVKITQGFLPHALGAALLVTKRLHDRINGFDEKILLAEDHHYARRANKLAKYGLLKTMPVSISNRRFKSDGRMKTCMKYFLAEFYMVSFGPIKSDFFNYKFDHYHKD